MSKVVWLPPLGTTSIASRCPWRRPRARWCLRPCRGRPRRPGAPPRSWPQGRWRRVPARSRNRKVGPLDHVQQVAQGRRVRGHRMQVGGEALPARPSGSPMPPRRPADTKCSSCAASVRPSRSTCLRAGSHQPLDVRRCRPRAFDPRLRREGARLQPAARHGQHHAHPPLRPPPARPAPRPHAPTARPRRARRPRPPSGRA